MIADEEEVKEGHGEEKIDNGPPRNIVKISPQKVENCMGRDCEGIEPEHENWERPAVDIPN